MKYNMEVRAFDNLSTEGVSHDDFKAIKACNFANRTPLRFVHMCEHCFLLSHVVAMIQFRSKSLSGKLAVNYACVE